MSSKMYFMIHEIAKGSIKELLGELRVVDLPVLGAQREQAQFPGDEKHIWSWDISSTSWVSNELE